MNYKMSAQRSRFKIHRGATGLCVQLSMAPLRLTQLCFSLNTFQNTVGSSADFIKSFDSLLPTTTLFVPLKIHLQISRICSLPFLPFQRCSVQIQKEVTNLQHTLFKLEMKPQKMDAPLELLFKISHFVTKSLSLFNALEKQITVFYYRATTK